MALIIIPKTTLPAFARLKKNAQHEQTGRGPPHQTYQRTIKCIPDF